MVRHIWKHCEKYCIGSFKEHVKGGWGILSAQVKDIDVMSSPEKKQHIDSRSS